MKLGDEARDRVSGFRGTITGEATYLSGAHQFFVQPRARDGAFLDGRWIDVGYLEPDDTPMRFFGGQTLEGPRRES